MPKKKNQNKQSSAREGTPKAATTQGPSKKKKTKAEQKVFDNLLKVTKEHISGKSFRPKTKESLLKALAIYEGHLDLFDEVLAKIHADGDIECIDGVYHPKKDEDSLKVGIIKVHVRGFGFVETEDGSPDIFIPKQFTNSAVDLDKVRVLITGVDEKGPEGRVVEVIERAKNQIVAIVLRKIDEEYELFSSVFGDQQCIMAQKDVSLKEKEFERGDRVTVEISDWGSFRARPKGQIKRFIGSINDPSTDVPYAIEEFSIRHQFPKAVLEEAKSFGSRVTKKELSNRVDLRTLTCCTIDPDTAKDYDDAISIERQGQRIRLGVHIADVSHYVRENSHLDKEAKLRANSTYFPGIAIPMLPHALSNNLCSLREQVARLTVTVFMEFTSDGTMIDYSIVRSVIKSKKRLTYKQAKLILDDKKKSSLKPLLEDMAQLALLLQQKRTQRGSVQLSMPEVVIKVDETGAPTTTEVIEYDITHQMIEEFMLKANEVVAQDLARQGKNVSFRVHEEPAHESLRDFSRLVNSFGHTLPDSPTPYDIQKLFQEVEGTSNASYIATCYIRSMRLAAYSPDNIGHYGLSLEHYTHFTSPIRRYVDTIIHRLLFEDDIKKELILDISKHASQRERLSAKAEQSVVTMKKLRLLQARKLKGESSHYEAIITKIKPFGIIFDLLEFMLDGSLHISELGQDYYVYDERKMRLIGERSRTSFAIGDRIMVTPKQIDLIKSDVSWRLLYQEKTNTEAVEEISPKPQIKKKKQKKTKRSR